MPYAYRDFEDMDDNEQAELLRQANEIADLVDAQSSGLGYSAIVEPPPPNSG